MEWDPFPIPFLMSLMSFLLLKMCFTEPAKNVIFLVGIIFSKIQGNLAILNSICREQIISKSLEIFNA